MPAKRKAAAAAVGGVFDASVVESSFGAKVVAAGREYAEKGHVDTSSVEIDRTADGFHVVAQCEGQQEPFYNVKVTVGGASITKKWCSCRVGKFGSCKHIAATLFHVVEKGLDAFTAAPKIVTKSVDKEQEARWKKACKEKKKELANLSIPELKELLKANRQPVSGTKAELLERATDGAVRGALPKCPRCHGGYLRFNPKAKKARYFCKGYFDDDTFVPCHFEAEEVERGPWTDLEKGPEE
eukprot:NODE_3520_length_961_cov_83.653509_g3233_i0.p1 GENE.NODE_3520_length_961_cov_83.653509_g3233_i0~~NODE_3520_length_961_cov_83.653509_g3233_i0.p1  ORF type:complete len:241 (-),score=47.82 NODE_3520_length_961_cov_83.653509_g3233_i0:186-908(-)